MAAYKDEERGTWYVSFHYYDWTGKNKRKLKRGFKTRKEALEWEQHFRMREESNLDMTFADFWKSYEMDMRPKLKENTWNTKEAVVQSKILPYFKDKKMKDIKAKDIITWQNKMSALKGADGKPFKPTFLKTIQSELSALFNHAVRFYELKDNPVVKAGPLGKGKADEMNFWTREEYLKFIEAVKDKPVSYYAFQILYWCGLRCGELLALCPGDIDTGNKILHITKSYQRIKGKDVITDPKTPKSKRDVSIPDFLCGELEQYLGMLYGYQTTDRIFQISKSYLHHEMDRGAAASGVKRIRIHDLRHSHVSLTLINVLEQENVDLSEYDLVGFASGIYYSKFHKSVLKFAEQNLKNGTKVFFVYTYGVEKQGYTDAIRAVAEGKGAYVIGEYGCLGFNTFGPFKLIGGIAKGHPDAHDLEGGIDFYQNLLKME